MNHAERSVLSPVLRRVREVHGHAWWELKRQIWDGGFQPYYPMQGEFELPAKRALERLDSQRTTLLQSQWRAKHPKETFSAEAVVQHYVYIAIEELVKRATQAAYRTSNW